MTESEQNTTATVTQIWEEAIYEGGHVRVAIRNGSARILIAGLFDVNVPGEYDNNDFQGVLEAHKRQMDEISQVMVTELPEDWEPPCSDLGDGCEALADIDFPVLEERKCEVVYLDEVRRRG